jgi:threonylcarbamoyladenosine tRNA methylthiotransferase MtaB
LVLFDPVSRARYNLKRCPMKKTLERTTVALDCLGCKLNQAEIQELSRQLETAGYQLVDTDEKADIYVLNTCSVTHIADSKSRQLLRQARRRNPAARLVAIGCYAQRAPEELTQIEGVELALGNDKKMNLLALLGKPADKDKAAASSRQPGGRTRAFIKVQDGCKNFCAYCIVPLVRSKLSCVSPEKVINLVKELTGQGCQEVVLTGTEVGSYDVKGTNIEGLLKRILESTTVPRIRLSSLQPHQVTPQLIGLWKDARLCPHFHLSLQSGSDTVLKRMNRRYTTVGYRQTVELIRANVPDAAITTDVIVGFPGETEAEFKETLDGCREMNFARIHVFPFSARPGTKAETMPGKIPDAVKKERMQKMLALAETSARKFHEGFCGKKAAVLWEKETGGVWSGLTGSYIKVYTKTKENLANRIIPVNLVKLYRDGVWGEVETL